MNTLTNQGKELIIRKAGVEDNLGSKQLQESYTEGGRISTKITIKIEDANTALDVAHPGNYRLLAFFPDKDMPVGTIAGWPHLVRAKNSDEYYPAVLVHRLAVHPDYRNQGIARALWLELRRWIKSIFVMDKVIVYGYFQNGNEASRAWFKSCGGNFTNLQITNAPIKTVTPIMKKGDNKYSFQEMTTSDTALISDVVKNLNDFYMGFSLYKLHFVDEFVEWLSQKKVDNTTYKLSRYYVATTPEKKVVAGIGIFDLNQLVDVQVVDPPAIVQVLNKLLKIFPKDGLMKTGQVTRVWYHPDHLEAGRSLWQEVRQKENIFSNNLLISADLSSEKLSQLFKLSKIQPMTKNNLVLLMAPKEVTISNPLA